MKYTGSFEFEIVERTEERVASKMPVGAGIKNPFGVVHAGAMLWFADVTATILAMGPGQSTTPGMKGFPLAISLNANFTGNLSDGTLTATSTFVKRGRTVSVVRTAVTGPDGKLLADVTTSHVPSK